MKLGDKVKSGHLLGTVTDPITNLTSDIVSPVNGKVIGMAVNQVVMNGYATYHIGIDASETAIINSPDDEPEYISEEIEPEDE